MTGSTRLREIQALRSNWDSYAAAEPRADVVRDARQFLKELGRVFRDYSLPLPVPFVVPTRDGRVQFEWTHGGRELELEVAGAGAFNALRVYETGAVEETAVTRWQAIRFVKWLATGEQA